MKPALHKKSPKYPATWDELPAGEAMRDAISEVCDQMTQRVFGYHFLKLGNLSSQITLPSCAIKHQIAQTRLPSPFANVQAQSHVLPYVENSIDGVLLANELDFAQDPHQILREVDRVITDKGYVILSGFNPYSLTGVGKYLPINRQSPLHDARFFSASRIKDWLQLLGFEIVEQEHLLFSMLFFSRGHALPQAWQNWCRQYCPWCASVYVILARKRTFPMSLIKPKWKLKPSFSAVGASMRETHLRDHY